MKTCLLVVTDALDGNGTLSIDIKPVGDGRDINCVAVGAAVTAGNNAADIMGTLAALNFIQGNDILVASVSAHQGCAAAGDRVMGMLKNCGASGFVTDGPMRDYNGLIEVGLPAWYAGLTPASPFTKVQRLWVCLLLVDRKLKVVMLLLQIWMGLL